MNKVIIGCSPESELPPFGDTNYLSRVSIKGVSGEFSDAKKIFGYFVKSPQVMNPAPRGYFCLLCKSYSPPIGGEICSRTMKLLIKSNRLKYPGKGKNKAFDE